MFYPEALEHWKVASDASRSEAERLTACWSLQEFGAFEASAGLLNTLRQSAPRDELLDICSAVAAADDVYHTRPSSMTADVAIACRPGAQDMLVVFAGDGPRFLVLPPLFRRRDTHVVLVRNMERNSFFSSLYGLGDNQEANGEALLRIAARLGAVRVHTLGMSVGGNAALRFGLQINATSVTCFGAIVSMLPGTDSEVDRHSSMLNFMKHPSAEQLALMDVVGSYRQAAARPRTRLYFGEGCEVDRTRAAYLEGLENVSLHTVAGVDDHHCLGAACNSGEIDAILAQAIEE
jgi:hypothetical protein